MDFWYFRSGGYNGKYYACLKAFPQGEEGLLTRDELSSHVRTTRRTVKFIAISKTEEKRERQNKKDLSI
jgi:hypothetical protein